jgi:hypothetical protein
MNTAIRSESPVLAPATSGFVLSAAITVVFNTALAWAKDVYPPLNDFMRRIGGHHWTTHGYPVRHADRGLNTLLGLP